MIERIYRAEWPDAPRYPSCGDIATKIAILRAPKAAENQSKRRRKSPLDKAGQSFLAELGKIVPWTGEVPQGEATTVLFDPGDIYIVETTRKYVELTLAIMTAGQHEPARYLAAAFVQAWVQVDVKITPKPTKEDAPLCQAVTAALRLAGIKLSAGTVLDRLRGRERRLRSGGRKKA
jgi:hypothetical protein